MNREEEKILLEVVDNAIKFGLKNNRAPQVNIDDYTQELQENRASFVTLEIEGKLRGCIGTLEAFRPLVQDVAQNAYAAAFEDSRFKPLTADEYKKLTKRISILSAPEKISFTCEKDLLKKIRPRIDGLILSDKGNRGTFLPSVWDELPKPKLFLQHLKQKAGLPEDYWSKTLNVERYTTNVIGQT